MSITLNAKEAKKADMKSNRIEDGGKYIGTIKEVELSSFASGAKGLRIFFQSDEGQDARFINIITHKKDGGEAMGMQLIHAIMACLKIKQMNEANIEVERYDESTKEFTIKESAVGYPELVGQRIGFLLQKEISKETNAAGNNYVNIRIYAPFMSNEDLKKQFTATEFLNSEIEAKQIHKMTEYVNQNPTIDNREKSNSAPASPNTAPAVGDEFDDDIPF